jgi:hypothetical protein
MTMVREERNHNGISKGRVGCFRNSEEEIRNRTAPAEKCCNVDIFCGKESCAK